MKVNGTGLFAERLLYIDWLEERSQSANPTVVTPSDEFIAPAVRADGINVGAARVILRGKEDSHTTPRPQGEVLAESAGGQARKYSTLQILRVNPTSGTKASRRLPTQVVNIKVRCHSQQASENRHRNLRPYRRPVVRHFDVRADQGHRAKGFRATTEARSSKFEDKIAGVAAKVNRAPLRFGLVARELLQTCAWRTIVVFLSNSLQSIAYVPATRCALTGSKITRAPNRWTFFTPSPLLKQSRRLPSMLNAVTGA